MKFVRKQAFFRGSEPVFIKNTKIIKKTVAIFLKSDIIDLADVLADMAQLVEQRIRNAWVRGSSPLIGL